MIKRISMDNFKCFDFISLELSKLNILAGTNDTGNSTVIQSLLTLRQLYDRGTIYDGIIKNKRLLCREDIDQTSITINTHDIEYDWLYQCMRNSDFQYSMRSMPKGNNVEQINLFQNTFMYISTKGIEIQRSCEQSQYIGNDALHLKLNTWLSEITNQNIRVIVTWNIGSSTTDLWFVNNNEILPPSIEYGINHVAPIVVGLLEATPGSLMIIENPELYLHPKGQRKLGELIACVCANGVQIILSTHSDHLLNGIRISVKNNNINANDIKINYFYDETKDGKCIYHKCSPTILSDGSLTDWPEGFFDEWDKAIMELF